MKGQINLSLPDTVVGFRNLERRVRYRKPTRTLTPHRSVYFVKRHSDRHAPWVSRERNLRSKIRWFTEFCNSHYLSQLATFVIEARTKRFTVRSCHSVKFSTRVAKINWTFHCGLKCKIYEHVRGRVLETETHLRRKRHPARSRQFTVVFHTCRSEWESGNDPSAGSPTETLLRLLLPLNDQVWKSFRQSSAIVADRGRRQSQSLTKPFNR